MSRQSAVQTNQTALASPLSAVTGSVVQRACTCGQHTIGGGECAACRKKRALHIQRAALDTRAGGGHNPAESSPSQIAAGFGQFWVSQPDDRHEQEATYAAAQVMRAFDSGPQAAFAVAAQLSPVRPLIQRAEDDTLREEAAPATPPPAPATTEPAQTAARSLLVDDSTETVEPGQMRQGEFLGQLRPAVCAAANAVLAGVGRSTEGCPYLDYWFNYYGARNSQQTEQAIHRYAPETASATTARDYIPLIVARVRQAVEVWARTGQVNGVPAEASTAAPESAGAGSAAAMIQFQGQAGGPHVARNPATIQAQLRGGQPLDSSVRARMETAFGYDFSGVRVHTDTVAAGLSAQLNARAFTIGRDVAFGAGEYHPGTLLGDALVAHELAHVVQQNGGSRGAAPLAVGEAHYNHLEADADQSAVGALAALWGRGVRGMKELAQQALPRLRSGVRLQRCTCDRSEDVTPTTPIAVNLPAFECSPTAASLDDIKKLPGVPSGVLGVTKVADIHFGSKLQSHMGSRCSISIDTAPSFALERFFYTQPGVYDMGTETPIRGRCKGKTVAQKLTVTKELSDKVKQGESEHCEDDRRAYALSYGRYVQVFNELAPGFCAAGTTCENELKTRFKARLGIDYDKRRSVSSCLLNKTGLRDTNNWHTLVIQEGRGGVYARDCSIVTYTPDHTKNLLEVGKHPPEEVVKGCGE